MSAAYMNRARGRSLSQQPNDDEVLDFSFFFLILQSLTHLFLFVSF